jgi:rhamnosyl/mannosyltransferase
MKVLHVGKYFPPFKGGMENYMRDIVVALCRCGVKCAVLVHQHDLTFKSSEEKFETDGSQFTVVRAGVMFRFLYTPVSPFFPLLLKRLIRDFQPDVLHIHAPNSSAFFALTLARLKRIPWVLHWHADVVASSPLMKFTYFFYQALERKLLKRANTIVVTSKVYRDSSEPLSNFLHKCQVVPLALDSRRLKQKMDFYHLNHSPKERRNLNVLAVGRLTYYKGFEYLIMATAMVEAMGLSIVGTGEKEQVLKTLVARLGLENRVVFHGFLSDQELIQQYSQCDCVCLPSIERTEAFGVVLLEAMYFGKATLVSDVPGSGMGCVVEDRVTGIKVEPENPESLAQAMNYMAKNRDIVQRMGQCGKREFEKRFEISQSINALISIYDQLLE